MDMRKLLEAVTKFAGEPEQKPGDQVRGTEKAKVGGKEHPFKGRLVGDSKDNMLKGLAQVAEDKSLEWELAEAYAKFMEDDLGVEPKRPSRKGSRHARGHEPKSGYTTVKADEEVDEGRGDSKGLHKKVTIVKGPDAGKTGYVRQIKTDRIRNRVYLDLDLEDGGQAVVLKQDVRLVKEVDEAVEATGIEAYGVKGVKSTPWRKTFKNQQAFERWLDANEGDVEVQGTRDYNAKDTFKEGWESGPEERAPRERDPDAEYDARRQEKLDIEAEKAQAQRPQEKYYTLVGRGPNMEPNYEFPGEYATQDEADAARARLMADPKTPNPRDIGISRRTRYLGEHWDQEGYDPRGQNPELAPGQKALKGKPVTAKAANSLAKDAFAKAFGGTANDLTKNLRIREGIESADPIESAVLNAVQELIQQGHTEVAPEVITNMVVAATSQPFLLKDLVDVNNNSAAVQHYVDSINPTKVKFSNEILTVKNEDPAKDKAKAQSGVSNMAARAANRNRLGEGTSDSRKATLVAQYKELQTKLREFKESRGHEVIKRKLQDIESQKAPADVNDLEQRAERAKAEYRKYVAKMQKKNPDYVPLYKMDEAGSAIGGGATGSASSTGTAALNPDTVKQTTAALNTFKSATGSNAPAPNIAKALDAVTKGTAVGSSEMKILEPVMKDLATVATDPKLAGQFKSLAGQVNQTQQKQQQAK